MAGGIVIIGAGQAALQFAASLRLNGCHEKITLLGQEHRAPYMRPPLSKSFLKGDSLEDDLMFRAQSWYEEQSINLQLQVEVTAIDAASKKVMVHSTAKSESEYKSGPLKSLSYDRLVIATGTRVRKLPPTIAPPVTNCLYLRTLDDAHKLKAATAQASNIVVIGGGFIGLEYAAAARQLGKQVMLVEAGPRLMGRAVSPFISELFAKLHRSHGVDIRLDTGVSKVNVKSIELAQSRACQVLLDDGEILPCDLVVVGIGAIANDELAMAAGIETQNGVLVDQYLATSEPDIYAMGDCARFPFSFANTTEPVLLESVQNAVDQAKYLAARFTGKETKPFAVVPWFWSEQYQVKLQIAGMTQTYEEEKICHEPAKLAMSVEYHNGGVLAAVYSLNDARGHFTARKRLKTGLT